ncbi:hypothetical protein BIY22_00875 [Vibrio panuliri]|uniref:Uncharacterized protein n=1 Tax=Vibrio panuliri TaxID=1381081 RepID=A0A1Q9HQC4_9VIBR|nr:hypothetical protein [Vibrio panuliri]OLQ93077.1 hypothetical protein BIY22_00875 [Vibrio panuliri]
MNQFDKHQIITLDIQNPQQIESALNQYQALLRSGDAFNQHHFDVEFKQQDSDGIRRLQPSDAGENIELLKASLNMGQEGGSHYYRHAITDESEVYISEVILFAAALQYPDIKPTVVDTAKAIVAYARRVNDTDDMWIDDMRVFGIEAVYMLAKTDLQYAYLVGQFFVPYWDDEHATQYEEYLASLLVEHGWHPEVIKAFIWCDNPSFRSGMFMDDPYSDDTTYQPLGEYLQQNPCQYAHFKQMVMERFQAEPVLLTSYDESDEDEPELSGYKPVIWLYQTLFARSYDDEDEDAFMQQPFMASTLEDEAYDLQCYIENRVNTDLVKPSERALEKRAEYRAYLERDDRRYDLNYGSEVLKPLILAMPQGESLWRYIENGTELQALEALQEIELLPLAHQYASEMAAHMDDHVCKWEYNNQGIAEELESVLELVRGDLLTDHFGEETTIEHANGLITTLTVTPDSEVSLLKARCEQYLRVVDVFYRALGKREFSEYMMDSLTDDDEPLLSRQDYYRRYSQLPEPQTEAGETQDGALTREVQSIFYTFTDNDEILCKKNFELVDSVMRSSRDLCHPQHYPKKHMGCIALASYQLYTDFNQRIGDEVTEALFNYLNEQNIWQQAVDKILQEAFVKGGYHCPEHKGLTEQDIARVRDYFCADQPTEDQASLIALLEPQLHRDDCCRGNLYLNKFSEYQPGYDFLSDHDEDFQRFTLIAFWLRQLPLPLPQRVQADRLWQFITALAPVRVARNVLRAYSDGPWSIEFNNVLDEIEIHEQLEKAGIDSGILRAFEMSRVSSTRDIEKYSHWLDRYSEITNTSTSMFGSLDRKKAEALHQGLKFINESDRVAFLHHASLKYPEITLDIEHDFARALRIVVELNTTSWEFALAHELGACCLYVGEGEKVPANLRKAIISDEHTVHDKPCHMDGMSWMISTIVQQQGDQYVVLMADQEVPLEAYRNGLPNGQLVILDETADRQEILQRILQLQQTPKRVDYLVEQTLAYLAGDVDYSSISTLYRAQIATENFRPSADEYRLYTLGQLMWMLAKPQRDRLAKLLFNHDYRGFKVIENQHEKAWLIHQLAQGDIDFDNYLEQEREEETSEEGMLFLLRWMLELEIDPAHMTLFCIKHAEFEACGEFIRIHARGQYGSFKQTLDYLHAGRRAQLPEILSQADDATQLMEPLAKDRSRVVKEALARCVFSA